MFSSVGWGELVVLVLAALFIFGPERLPHLAQDAAAGLKRVKGAMSGARGSLHDTLGPDFDHLKDVDLRQYHPKALIRKALTEDDESDPVGHLAAGRARMAERPPTPPEDDPATGSGG